MQLILGMGGYGSQMGITVAQTKVFKYEVDTTLDKRGMCIKGLFWPPLELKIENCFSPISFDCFIRRITEL